MFVSPMLGDCLAMFFKLLSQQRHCPHLLSRKAGVIEVANRRRRTLPRCIFLHQRFGAIRATMCFHLCLVRFPRSSCALSTSSTFFTAQQRPASFLLFLPDDPCPAPTNGNLNAYGGEKIGNSNNSNNSSSNIKKVGDPSTSSTPRGGAAGAGGGIPRVGSGGGGGGGGGRPGTVPTGRSAKKDRMGRMESFNNTLGVFRRDRDRTVMVSKDAFSDQHLAEIPLCFGSSLPFLSSSRECHPSR